MTNAEQELVGHNARFLSGAYGLDVVLEYTGLLLDYDSWDVPLLENAKEDLGPSLACCLGDAWRRLYITYVDDTKCRLFDACHTNGVPHFSKEKMTRVAEQMRDMSSVCEECVDPDWTGVLLPLFQRAPFRAYTLLTTALLCLRVTTTAVERGHLPGAESKPAKARGRALTAEMLGITTYLTTLSNDARVLTDSVTADVLRAHRMSTHAYSQLRSALTVNTASQRIIAKLICKQHFSGMLSRRTRAPW